MANEQKQLDNEQLIKLREEFNARIAKLSKDVGGKLDAINDNVVDKLADIKASHEKVTDTKTNGAAAYFFRAIEIVTCACVIYSVLNSVF